jgi:hypothetical protein
MFATELCSITCQFCRTETLFTADLKDIVDFTRNIKNVQDAFPYLSEDTRELIVSKTCGTCFDEILKAGDDELCPTCKKNDAHTDLGICLTCYS